MKAAYATNDNDNIDAILNDIPHLSASGRSAFHLFSSLIPRLVPIQPFLELCDGYETDMAFVEPTPGEAASPLRAKLRNLAFDIDRHLPIRTTEDLMQYADNVAGSIAAAICYLSWSILTSPIDPAHALSPVDALTWTAAVHAGQQTQSSTPAVERGIHTVSKAREMGRALQLVNISRDIAKDALIGRLYVPISLFDSAKAIMAVLLPDVRPSYAPYTSKLLDLADSMRASSIPATADLPRTARGGVRAMAASYFEIAAAVRRNGGEVEDGGIRVAKWRRALAAAKAFWFGIA